MTSESEPFSRRDFMTTVGQVGTGACVALGTGWIGARDAKASDPLHEREVDFYESLPGRQTRCHVCPLNCLLRDGETCFCRTRTNIGGRLYTTAYANPCTVRVEPVEKAPLFHFHPAMKCLTLGVGGCNARCVYCQNADVSQKLPGEVARFDMTPERAVSAALERNLDAVAFNFTEPVAFLEYATDVARLARRASLRVVCATSAYINPEPLVAFAEHVDAFIVTLKGFSEAFYHDTVGLRLAPVLAAIQTIRRRTDAWLELAHLIVPGRNGDVDEIRRMSAWVRNNVGAHTPLHFARFVPAYRMAEAPQTAMGTLEQARRVAMKTGLRHVYLSNVAAHPGANTYCPRCHRAVIQRAGFDVLKNDVRNGRCVYCDGPILGAWS